MAPYTRAATSKSIALRMKALQMKRSCKKVPSACEVKGASPIKVKAMSPKKKSLVKVSPKKTASKIGNVKSISKKTMSSNGSNSKKQCKSSKLKKAEEVSVNITGGLRLLKRGMVTMNRITRRLLRGKKLKVVFNAKGEPIGAAAREMQSYIGVLARSKVPISVPDWREVDPEIKQKIWECIEMSFVVPKELRKLVVTSAANKWREFKCKLTKWYILPYIDSPELLEFPPDDYRSIEKADWDIFVANRISADFQELREIQIEKRKENKYPHLMARKGYANLQEELSETLTEEELDRATMWIKARQDKNGNFKQEEVEQKAKKIIKLQKKVAEGKLTTEGTDDVLTLALGKPEHPGRVRGVGGSAKPASYFNLPKRRRLSVEDTVRKSVRAILEEEKEAIIAKERAIWVERLEKLEAKLEGKTFHGDSAKPVTPRNEHVSAQGSCSRQGEHGMKEGESDEVKTVKKMLTLKDDVNLFIQENIVEEPKVKKKLESIMEHEDQNGMDAKKVEIHQVVQSSGDECKLALDSLDNIVAIGTIIEVAVQSSNQTIHGVPLGEGNMRVSVIRSIIDDAKLPFPIKDDIMTVHDAIGTCVAWPKNMIVSPNLIEKKQVKLAKVPKKSIKRKRDFCDDYEDDLQNLSLNMPEPLRKLCLWANDGLRNGATIQTTLSEHIFGSLRKTYVFRSDLYAMANMKEVSASSIVMYMSYIYDVLKKSKMVDMAGLVDPAVTGALGCGNSTERSRSLSTRFKNAKAGQIFLVPYNSGCHWMLTVVNPDEEIVYFMDPLKRRLVLGDEWSTIVDNSIKIYNAHHNRKGRKAIKWKNCSGIPMQNGDKDCGYFIMRYMKEIVEDKNLDFGAKWERRNALKYTQHDIDEVRAEWAKHVVKFPTN